MAEEEQPVAAAAEEPKVEEETKDMEEDKKEEEVEEPEEKGDDDDADEEQEEQEEEPAPRAKRERKQVQRIVPAPTPEKKTFEIPKGGGTALGDIENVDYHIGAAKHKAGGPELKTLYRLCYGRVGKKLEVKAHLRKFTGYADAATKTKAENIADGLKITELKTQLTICDLELAGKKEELVERLINFLNEPTPSGKKSLADKDAEKKAKALAKKQRLEKKRERNKLKREKAKKKKEREAKKKAAAKKKKEAEKAAAESDSEEESEEESESEEEDDDEESDEEEEERPKKKAKKKPAKESSDDDDDDLPIGSLSKPKITDALLAEKVTEMAKSSDFETLSLKIIRDRLAEELGQDMGPYKKQIKAVVIKAIGA